MVEINGDLHIKGKIEIASQEETERLEKEIDFILETVGRISDSPEITGMLVTDETILADAIPLNIRQSEEIDQFLNELSAELNTEVSLRDFIIDIAKKINL